MHRDFAGMRRERERDNVLMSEKMTDIPRCIMRNERRKFQRK